MRALVFLAAFLVVVGVPPAGRADPAPELAVVAAVSQVSFESEDGVEVFADLYPSKEGKSGPLVLLFHQAGSNAGEYAPIAPRLVELGFSCLAVDQRSGGRRWDRNNRTVLRLGRSEDFAAAYTDLETALTWAREQGWTGPTLAWGSSYSAALVFRLASEHAEVSAVLAFSPGEYLGEGTPVRDWASKVSVPVYATSAGGREVTATRSIVDALASAYKSQYVAHAGVHGSSTLRADLNPGGYEENWQAVAAFLRAPR